MRTDASERREKENSMTPPEHPGKPASKDTAEISNSSITTAQLHADKSANNLVKNNF